MRSITNNSTKTLLLTVLVASLSSAAFATTYSGSSSSIVTSGPRVSAPMAPASSDPNMINNPQTIRSCLCLQSAYQSQATVVSGKQSTYTQAVNQKSQLETMLANAHAGTSPEQLNQIRQASEQRIMLNNQINNALLPDLQNATAQYNQSVAAFQQTCGGKTYNADMLAQAQQGLTCQGG